jgi:oligoendopeptidase F
MTHTDREAIRGGWGRAPYLLYEGGEADPEGELSLIRERAASFAETHKGKLNTDRPDPRAVLHAIREYESIHEAAMRPLLFARLLRSADTHDPVAARLFHEVREAWEEAGVRLAFFPLELAALSDQALASLAADNDMSFYGHFLARLTRTRPHLLSEPEERIIRRKALTGRRAHEFLYDELLGEVRTPIRMGGKPGKLGTAQILALQQSHSRAVRTTSLETLLRELGKRGLVFSGLLNALVLDRLIDCRMRGHTSPMDPRHLENEVDGESIEAMLGAVEQHGRLARAYARLKAGMLGLDRLSVCDLMAPVSLTEDAVSLDDALAGVLEAAGGMHPLFHSTISGFLAGSRIDAETRPAKESGAFCACLAPSQHPWISLHYSGRMRDVMLLAHELGHGIHYRVASGQTYLNFPPQPVIAEGVSVFMEILTARRFMEHAPHGADPTGVLACHIDGLIATVFRQAAITRFEQSLYAKRQYHYLSAAEIGETWMEENARIFGEDLDMTPSFRWGWVLVPHLFHLPFYCCSYVFGGLLAMALFREYEKDGPEVAEHILRMLRSGGSRAPLEMLAEIGINARESSFWDRAFEYLEEVIESLAGRVHP